jgi:hypothetical protein
MPGEGVIEGPAAGVSSLPNLVKLRTLVYAALRDGERSFNEPWFVDEMLNEAYLDLNARLRLNKQEVSGTTEADGEIPFPTDLVEIENLYVSGSPVSFMDDDTFLSFQQAGVVPYGANDVSVLLGRVHQGTSKIETFPAAVSESYVLEYIARPATMEAESDIPSKLTKELIPRIVNYARAYCKWQEDAEAEGAKFMALYEQGLPGAPRDAFRRKPFPLSMIPEAGPFD